MNKINVAIADDNQRTVEMMTELLEQESDIEVIASAMMEKKHCVSSRKTTGCCITGYYYAETRWNWGIRTFANRRSK